MDPDYSDFEDHDPDEVTEDDTPVEYETGEELISFDKLRNVMRGPL